jgi:tetratricopeptide (TPR) repeat protein
VLKEWWERLSWVEAGSSAGLLVVVVMMMSGVSVVALVWAWLASNIMPLAIAGVGWGSFLLFVLLHATVLRSGAGVVTAKGGSTPSVNQHSNIAAMVARGRLTEAAQAYKAVIAADPEDLLACEELGQLALRELKDYQLALFAVHEAEKRAPDDRRRMGFALLAVNIYRDNLKDYGRTMVELRRLLARYPDVPNAEALRAEIDELKALHFEAR